MIEYYYTPKTKKGFAMLDFEKNASIRILKNIEKEEKLRKVALNIAFLSLPVIIILSILVFLEAISILHVLITALAVFILVGFSLIEAENTRQEIEIDKLFNKPL